MEQVVWKFPLNTNSENVFKFPVDSQILDVKIQNDSICMWVLMGASSTSTIRRFVIVGTGHPFQYAIKRHIGTVMTRDHSFVFHVFEV